MPEYMYTCQSVSKSEGLDIVEGATCVTRSICSKQHRDPISELTTIGNSKKRIASGSQRGVFVDKYLGTGSQADT